MTRPAFIYELGQQHDYYGARRLEAQIIDNKEIIPSRHSSIPVHGVHQL
jgi:hypothetical protein